MMYQHSIYLRHNRATFAPMLGDHPSESDVEVSASSTDLTEAWRELLSRLPSDVYAALKAAMDQRS